MLRHLVIVLAGVSVTIYPIPVGPVSPRQSTNAMAIEALSAALLISPKTAYQPAKRCALIQWVTGFSNTAVDTPSSFIGQGSSALAANGIILKAPTPALAGDLDDALSYLQALSEGRHEPDDTALLFRVLERLRTLRSLGPNHFGVFDSVIRSPEDYLLAFAAADRVGLSRQVVQAMTQHPDALAEVLFHEGYASLERESSKTVHQDRYSGVQRRLFPASNAVRQILRNVINNELPDDLPMRNKSKLSRTEKRVEQALYAGFRHAAIPEQEAKTAASTLVRGKAGAIRRLVFWGVVSQEEADVLSDRSVAPSTEFIAAVAHRMAALLEPYRAMDWDDVRAMKILHRLVPHHIFNLLLYDTEAPPSMLLQFVADRPKFDEWVYQAQTLVREIAPRVGGSINAWHIINTNGLDETRPWISLAEPAVASIAPLVGGPAIAWKIITMHGLENIRKWVGDARRTVRQIEEKGISKRFAWSIVFTHGLKGAKRWAEKALSIVDGLAKKVGGNSNAWNFVIRHGLQGVDSWFDEAQATAQWMTLIMGAESYAWKAILSWDVEGALNWLDRAFPIFTEVKSHVHNAGYSWQVLINQRPENAVEWIQKAAAQVAVMAPLVGGKNLAWAIAVNYGHAGAADWVIAAKPVVDRVAPKVGGRRNAWTVALGQGLDDADDWVEAAGSCLQNLSPIVGSDELAWGILIDQGIKGYKTWLGNHQADVALLVEKGVPLVSAWRQILHKTPSRHGLSIEQIEEAA